MDISKQLALIAAVEHENETQYCRYCGKKLWHTKGHKPKKYCSDKCRKACWYRNHKGEAEKLGSNRMTKNQRNNIEIFRNLGFGYQKIANDMGLKKHQVRDYCRYHRLTGNASKKMLAALEEKFRKPKPLNIKNYCWNCGQETKLTRKYCSDKCRYDYNNRRRRTRYIED